MSRPPSLDNLRFPPGRKAGLKKDRKTRIMDRCESVRAVIEVIPRKHWDEVADTKWHERKREHYRYTSDQDGVGSCAAESAYNTKAACDTRQGLPLVVYNPLGMYHTTSGGRDNGSVIGDNLEFGRDKGCFPEEVWPRSKGWRREPSGEAYEIAAFFRIREFFYVETVEEFVSALLQGYNVHAGYSGHAVSFCRYVKRGRVEFKNSWGDWGDNGFGTLATSKIFFGYGAYAYKDAIPFFHPTKGWGVFESDGTFKPCPWKPGMDQGKLALAAKDYADIETARKIDGMKPMSSAQAEDTYAWALEKNGLAA